MIIRGRRAREDEITMRRHVRPFLGAALLLMSSGLEGSPVRAAEPATPEAARRFLDAAEARLLDLAIKQQRASWVQATYITDDTERLAAEANQVLIGATMDLAAEATRFDGLALPADVARRLKLLKLSLSLPAPRDPRLQAELTETAAWLDSTYGKGKYCPPGKNCLDIGELSRILAESRDPAALREAWVGWHQIAPPMRPRYERFVTLANQGARELGFPDLGALWRSGYDLPPDA